MSETIQLYDQADRDPIVLDWSDRLGTRVLASVDHVLPLPLLRVTQSTDAVNNLSQVTVDASAAHHGDLYMIEATATCTNGNTLNWQYPIRIWNS